MIRWVEFLLVYGSIGHTAPSPPTSPSEMMERGDDTASAACTSRILYRVRRPKAGAASDETGVCFQPKSEVGPQPHLHLA